MDKRCFWFLCIVILAVFLTRSTMAGAVVFDPSVYYDIGANPYSVAIGDLNGDGSPDLAAANYASEDISILLNNGDGTFQTVVSYPVDDTLTSIAIGDLNGDDNLDLAATTWWQGTVAVLLGNGDGTFQDPMHFEVMNYGISSVTIGDLDNDGNPSASAIPAVSYFAYGTLKYGTNVSCGDVDGDGIDEIITGAGPGAVFGPHVRGWNHDSSSVTPLPGFSFFAWDTEPLRYGVNVFAGADLNGDGRNELVAGRGPDPEADTEVKVFTYDGASVNRWVALEAFPGYSHGTNVAAGRF